MKNSISEKIGLAAIVTGSLILFSCVTNVLTGQTVKETRDFPAFTGVSLSFSGDVFITQGSQQKVVIEADKSTMELIISEVEGNTLVLKTREGHWRNMGDVKVLITMPKVEQLSVAGSGDMICETQVKTHEIDINVSGSGSVKMNNLETHEISAEVTGSGNIILSGDTNGDGELDATITGSGNIKSEGIAVKEATVRITGSGSATVNVLKELESDITGSGSVLYKGNPLINANATGSGKTRSIN